MRRLIAVLLATCLWAGGAFASDFITFPNFPTRGQGPFDRQPWWYSGLTFYAPFDDPDNPLRLIKGTGTLSFTRATTATYTAIDNGYLSTAASGTARVESAGILIEGARTNLYKYSDIFNNEAWETLEGVTRSIDNIVGPGGAITAERFTEVAGGTVHYTAQSFSVTSGTTYTQSAYAQVGSDEWTQFTFSGGGWGTNSWANFHLTGDGAVGNKGSATTARINYFGSNWYRGEATAQATATATTGPVFSFTDNTDYVTRVPSYAGNTNSYMYFTSAQIEAGAFASSYIPTTSAAVTRNADVLTIATAGNIDNTQGSLYMEWTPYWASTTAVGSPVLWDAGGLKATYTAADQKINFTDGTNTISTAAQVFARGDTLNLAFRWGTSDMAIYINGGSAATGAEFTEPALNENLYIGSDVSSANQAFSNIKNTRIWNRTFTNSEMQLASSVAGVFAAMHFHNDVSSVSTIGITGSTYNVLSLTGGSKVATVKKRDVTNTQWIPSLQRNFNLQYAYSGASINIAVISDTHVDSSAYPDSESVLSAVINDIDNTLSSLSINDAFVLGDIVHDNIVTYPEYIAIRDSSNITNWHEIAGNHDPLDSVASDNGFQTQLGIPETHYSVTLGNIVFILLSDEQDDSGTFGELTAGGLTYLGDTMAANQDKNIIIMTHQGRYNTTRETARGDAEGHIKPVVGIEAYLAANNWDAWFCGHSHGWSSGPLDSTYIYVGDPS